MLKNIDFVRETYSLQIKALNQFINDVFPYLPNKDNSLIRFGGGTALAMYYFQHRLSFDVDLFVTDPQVMNYLSPKHWLEEVDLFNKNKYRDMPDHIRILYEEGNIKIDILVASNNTDGYKVDDSGLFFSDTVYVETIENIISKKIVYRKEDNMTRDIIDLAVFLMEYKNAIQTLIEKKLVSENDIKILCDTLKTIDKIEYLDEVEIVSPFEKFKETAINGPEIIIEHCNLR